MAILLRRGLLDAADFLIVVIITFAAGIFSFLIGAIMGGLYGKLKDSKSGRILFVCIVIVLVGILYKVYYDQTYSSTYARDYSDVKYCDKMWNFNHIKESCYANIGVKKHDYAACDSVDNKYKKLCVNVIALEIFDCKKALDQDECYLRQATDIFQTIFYQHPCPENSQDQFFSDEYKNTCQAFLDKKMSVDDMCDRITDVVSTGYKQQCLNEARNIEINSATYIKNKE